jgi:diguanylate cyclase (GGDEF)-like protein
MQVKFGAIWFASGLCIGAALLARGIHLLIVPGLLLLGFALWKARQGRSGGQTQSTALPQAPVAMPRTTRMFPVVKHESEDEPPPQSPWAAKEDRRRAWDRLEEKLDEALLDGLLLAKASLDGVHTLALFFPRRDDTWYLRVWISESQRIIPGAALQSHQGLVGKLMKDEVRRVLEGDIVTDSTLLQYYSSDERVRSIAGVPILVDGVRRGAVVVDSLREKAFDEGVIERLEALASVLGLLSWQSYQAFDLHSQKHQLHALAQYQRKFLERMSEDHIVANVLRYLQESVEAERYMVLARDHQHPSQGKVTGCVGEDAKMWEGLQFDLGDRGILQIVFEKEQVVNRQFNGVDYTSRVSPKEKPNLKLHSILAVPVPTDAGVDMVLCVESTQAHRFSEHHQNLLTSIARAAGFAMSRARLYSEKEHLASRDGLTGVLNHRTFQETFQNEILRAQRYGHTLAVLLLDIDFFKKVNDTFGHPVGDRVLIEVAAILQQNVRAGIDVLARYGGEEFVCLLVDVTRGEAAESAERIRRSVEAKVFDLGQQELRVTLSTGVALFPDDGRHGKDVLERSDKALYRAKESGRNRVVFYS